MERQPTSKLFLSRLTAIEARTRMKQSTANSFSSESIRDKNAHVLTRHQGDVIAIANLVKAISAAPTDQRRSHN